MVVVLFPTQKKTLFFFHLISNIHCRMPRDEQERRRRRRRRREREMSERARWCGGFLLLLFFGSVRFD